jgi:hypothetical protein
MRVYSFTLTSALKRKSELVNNPGQPDLTGRSEKGKKRPSDY